MVNGDLPPTEWNLNSYKINFIGQKMIRCFEYFEKAHFIKSFKSCQAIQMAISNRLDPEEKKQCELYENFIPRQTFKDDQGKNHINWNYVRVLKKYIEYVQELIKSKGLDLSEKGESSLF